MEGRLPETVLKAERGASPGVLKAERIRLTPFRKPLALLAKRRKSPELKALAQSLAVS